MCRSQCHSRECRLGGSPATALGMGLGDQGG